MPLCTWRSQDLCDIYGIYFQGRATGLGSFLAAESAGAICVMIWDEFQLLESCIKMASARLSRRCKIMTEATAQP